MEEVIIKSIKVYSDNCVEMYVICKNCGNNNRHTITHATTVSKNYLEIDFTQLGTRCCDNLKCDVIDYQLYTSS